MACMNPALRQQGSWGDMGVDEVGNLWMRSLPFRADENEAKIASSMLCDAVEGNDEVVVGQVRYYRLYGCVMFFVGISCIIFANCCTNICCFCTLSFHIGVFCIVRIAQNHRRSIKLTNTFSPR